VLCSKVTTGTQGLFCANFASSRGSWMACHQSWCHKCYSSDNELGFWIEQPQDVEGVKWHKKKVDGERYLYGRAGDHLMSPFQCDLCVFRNLQVRDPKPSSVSDQYLLQLIRRVSLDALWARDTSTVASNLRSIREMVKLSSEIGLQPPLVPIGPYPVRDSFGYGTALLMVRKSLQPGRSDERFCKFDTIRKMRTATMNQWGVSVEAACYGATILAEQKSSIIVSGCPTQSEWFKRFANGCKTRMGGRPKQDKAISREIMHAVMSECERRAQEQRGEEQALTISVAAYLVVSFCASLRGPEGFMLCLAGLRKYLDYEGSGKNAHVVVPLLGRFKGEEGEHYHFIPLPSVTKTGFSPRKWLGRLVNVRSADGITNGPAFCGEGNMEVASMVDYEQVFYDLLESVQEDQPELFDQDCDIRNWYGLFRSLRRGSTSLAALLNVSEGSKNLMNRWRKVEQAKGGQARFGMSEHYTDILLTVPAYLDYCRDF